MVPVNEISAVLDNMILSASGWRAIFAACKDGESSSEEVSKAHSVISGAASFVFAQYLGTKPLVLLGCDTRPTGKAIISAMIPVLLDYGCEVRYAGIVAAPEIMAWARTMKNSGNPNAGFIYIPASHNPIGHNGIKFGLTDGGVLKADKAGALIENFKTFLKNADNIKKIENLISVKSCDEVYSKMQTAKDECIKAYYDFCGEVSWGDGGSTALAMSEGLNKKPLGIVCDFNGSARAVSIDKDFFTALGFEFMCINSEPGKIAHQIVPEGKSLIPCAKLLENAHKEDSAFALGYVPDCDGDRGNLVIWDGSKARVLGAQEVFALAVAAELSHLVWAGELKYDDKGIALTKAAIAVNDPTSMRIDIIAKAFSVSVFRAEVGEANVVSLAEKLREEGYLVRILGEGSAGGNITHPSKVRDPVNTVLALAKMLCLRSTQAKPGLFEIWCKQSGQTAKYRGDFTLADIISSLPEYTTTPVYHKKAVMRIKTPDHALLKSRYQKIFLNAWHKKSGELKTKFGICGWEAAAYNGTAEKRGIENFGDAGKGGLKLLFTNDKGKEIAYIWMRGSATEPVFRIMADTEGSGKKAENYLLNWQRQMIIKADNDV